MDQLRANKVSNRQHSITKVTDVLQNIEVCVTSYLEKFFRKATKLSIGQLKDIAPTTISIKAKYKHGNYNIKVQFTPE